jgi:hypothetical protein
MPEESKDPKDWYVWWAGKLFGVRAMWKYMLPQKLSKGKKRLLFWIYLFMFLLCCVEIYYLNKIMK